MNDNDYHDISERLRNVDRAIVQLILIKEDYEQRIKEYLSIRDQSRE